MSAPERIWLSPAWAKTFPEPQPILGADVEYVRADLAPSPAYVAGLEAALRRDPSLTWIIENTCQVRIRDLALDILEQGRAALAARPAAPDVRVTPLDKLMDAYLLLVEARSDGVNLDMTQQLEGLISIIAYAAGCNNATVYELLSSRRATIGENGND